MNYKNRLPYVAGDVPNLTADSLTVVIVHTQNPNIMEGAIIIIIIAGVLVFLFVGIRGSKKSKEKQDESANP